MAANRFGLIVRSFSTSSVNFGKLVSLPVNVYGVEGRYATALYSAASKEKKLDQVDKEMKDFQALLKQEQKFSEFVSDPTVRKSEKRDVILAVLKKKNFSSVTTNLITVMAENNRFNKIDAIFNSFERIMSAHRGEVQCTITTAKPLEAGHLSELKTALNAFIQKGEVLLMETKVDPSIIGGMVVSIGDKFVDMSMASKIKTYTKLIKQAV